MKNKKFLIIESRPYGFFSVFLHTLDNLKWAEDNEFIPVVRWGPGRVDVNALRPGAEKATSLSDPSYVGNDPNFLIKQQEIKKNCLYVDHSQVENSLYSCWDHFFEPVSQYSISDALQAEHKLSDIFQVGFHDLNISSLEEKFLIFNLHSYTPLNLWVYLYNKKDTVQDHRKKVFSYINKFVKIKKNILDKVDNFTKEHFTEKVIGIHVRGTDKSTESNIGQRPFISIQDYIQETRKALLSNPNASLFVASDNNEAIGEIFKNFPNNKIIVYKCTRMSSYSSSVPVHLSKAAGPQLGEEALVDCLLLSRCDHLVCTDSNLSAAALYFNPNSKVSFVNLKGN